MRDGLLLGSLAAWVMLQACGSTLTPLDPLGESAAASELASGHQWARLEPAVARRFAELALDCVHREYPNKIGHVLTSDADVKPPRELTPAFYGCFDWHSSVHGHWTLARLARTFPRTKFAAAARRALAKSLTRENIAGELAYMKGSGRTGFERPYGLAWLLQLDAELRAWDDRDAKQWSATLRPLAALAAERMAVWLPKLSGPIRSGEHSQTAFAMGLALDWARTVGDDALARLIEGRAREFHGPDASCPIGIEPSGHDFLSPCLAEADLLRRVLPPDSFARWLDTALPEIPRIESEWIRPASVSDRADGKLAHLDGLNLSRAWMLEGIVSGLPDADPRTPALVKTARAHREAGLAAVTGEHYAGGHWLATYAVYLTSRRGLQHD